MEILMRGQSGEDLVNLKFPLMLGVEEKTILPYLIENGSRGRTCNLTNNYFKPIR